MRKLKLERLEERCLMAVVMDANGDGWLTASDVATTIQQVDGGVPGVYPIQALKQINELNSYGPHLQSSAELHRIDLPPVEVQPGARDVLFAAWDLVLEQAATMTTFQGQRSSPFAVESYRLRIGATAVKVGNPSFYEPIEVFDGTTRLEISGGIRVDAQPSMIQLGALRLILDNIGLNDISGQRVVTVKGSSE
jgi:hypothetical protein